MRVWIGYDSKTGTYDYVSESYDTCKKNCEYFNDKYKDYNFNFQPVLFESVEHYKMVEE